jgi:MFS transporter, CP family, cyanate transporter
MRPFLIAAVLFGMYAGFGAAWMAVVPLFPEIEAALAIPRADAAWLVSIVSLAKSVVPVLAGVVAARVGLTRTLRGAALLMTLGVIVPWLPGLWAWVLVRFLFGVGGAVWLTMMPAVVVDVFPAQRRALVNALNGVAVNTGVIVGLKLALPLKDAFGHQVALSLLASGCVLFLVGLVALGQITTSAPRQVGLGEVLRGYRSVLGERATWLIALAFTGPLALYLVINTWLPTHLEQAFGLSRAEAAAGLSFMNLCGIPASVAVGVMLLRGIGRIKTHILVGAVLLPTAMAGALLLDGAARDVCFALAGVGLFVPVAPLVTLLQRQPDMTAGKVGMVMGTMGSATYIVSSVAPNVVGAAVTAGVSLGAALLPCCLLGLTPLAALLLPEPDKS